MKTAVVLTGHMRCWQEAYPSIKEQLIDRYNADVFIATWDNLGYWTSPENDPENRGIHSESPPLNISEVVQAYQPKIISVYNQEFMTPLFDEKVKQYELDKISVQIRPRNIVSQFWIQQQGIYSLLSFDSPRYKYVIRLRPDLVFLGQLPKFDVERTYVINHPNHEGKGVGDMFMASSFDDAWIYGYKLKNDYHFVGALKMNRFCPHMITEKLLSGPKLEVMDVAKTLAHTPNGQYKDWKK